LAILISPYLSLFAGVSSHPIWRMSLVLDMQSVFFLYFLYYNVLKFRTP